MNELEKALSDRTKRIEGQDYISKDALLYFIESEAAKCKFTMAIAKINGKNGRSTHFSGKLEAFSNMKDFIKDKGANEGVEDE